MRANLLSFCVGLCTLLGCASTGSGPLRPVPEAGAAPLSPAAAGYRVELVDAWGRPLPAYAQGPAAWVEGIYGTAYAVRVHNGTGRRVEAVVTVDGRDVLTGEVGDFTRQRGYVIDPWGSVTIEGFRQSEQNVATFRFTAPGDSYGARMGGPVNLGVVGVALFPEEAPPPPPPPVVYQPRPEPWDDHGGLAREESARPSAALEGERAPSPRKAGDSAPAPAGPRAGNLGTQYGESRWSQAVEVTFRRARATEPEALIAVYYDDREGLTARGVLPSVPPAPPSPDPFPAARGYAPPPP